MRSLDVGVASNSGPLRQGDVKESVNETGGATERWQEYLGE